MTVRAGATIGRGVSDKQKGMKAFVCTGAISFWWELTESQFMQVNLYSTIVMGAMDEIIQDFGLFHFALIGAHQHGVPNKVQC